MVVMMTPREKWTDERLDDLNKKVDDGFADVKVEMRDRFDRLEAQIGRMGEHSNQGYDRMGERFHNLNMTLIAGFFAMIAALIGLIATQL